MRAPRKIVLGKGERMEIGWGSQVEGFREKGPFLRSEPLEVTSCHPMLALDEPICTLQKGPVVVGVRGRGDRRICI